MSCQPSMPHRWRERAPWTRSWRASVACEGAASAADFEESPEASAAAVSSTAGRAPASIRNVCNDGPSLYPAEPRARFAPIDALNRLPTATARRIVAEQPARPKVRWSARREQMGLPGVAAQKLSSLMGTERRCPMTRTQVLRGLRRMGFEEARGTQPPQEHVLAA